MKGLSEKVAIVTGGASGIGRATCIRLVEEGAHVVIADTNCEAGPQLEKQLRRADSRSKFIATDVSQEDSVVRMIDQTLRSLSTIHILVNCAAAFVVKGVRASQEDWRSVMAVNVMGCTLCTKHVIDPMEKCGSGSIVNVCSISALIAQPEYLTYSTSKGALLTATRCLACDLAPKGIRVNAVSPGTIWTKTNADYVRRTYGIGREEANTHPEIGGPHLLRRVGDPEEVASTITFLASDDASFITGANVIVDGGYTVR